MSAQIFECSPRDYHAKLRCNRADIFAADSFLSKSVLWELNDSSLYKWRFYPKKITPTPAMKWGSLVDCLTTTPELFEADYAVLPPDAPQRPTESMLAAAKPGPASLARQAFWADFDEASGDRNVVTADTLTEARKAAKMLTETCKASASIFEKSKSQVIVAAKIEDLNFKGLIDLAPEGEDFLADLKTTTDFSLNGFGKTLATLGYFVQGATYLRLWNARFPDDQRTRFKLIWQDSAPPYEVAVTEIAQHELEAGWAYATCLLLKLVGAALNDVWPMAFSGDEITLTRPVWSSIQLEEKMDSGELI